MPDPTDVPESSANNLEDAFLRFLRCVVVITPIFAASLLLCLFFADSCDWEDTAHILYRLASPLFMMWLFLPFIVGLIAGVVIGAFVLDRSGWGALWHCLVFWLVVLGILAVPLAIFGSLQGQPEDVVAAIAIPSSAAILHWVFLGRLRGRPGYRIPGIRERCWLGRAVYVASFLALWSSVHLGYEYSQGRVFHGGFPDAQSCIVKEDGAERRAEPHRMDWSRITGGKDAETCIFHVLSAVGGIAEARAFFEAEGFQVNEGSFSPENPYVERDGSLRISASWDIREKGPLFPTTGIVRRLLFSVPHAASVSVVYDAEGIDVLRVRLQGTTL
ncbi:MAG: hypothetical protein AAF919_13495 [Pseudomonadota bacterium]